MTVQALVPIASAAQFLLEEGGGAALRDVIMMEMFEAVAAPQAALPRHSRHRSDWRRPLRQNEAYQDGGHAHCAGRYGAHGEARGGEVARNVLLCDWLPVAQEGLGNPVGQ